MLMEVLTIRKIKVFNNQKGLTLIELLAVIIILAIIVAIAIPSISAIINNTRDKAILSDIASLLNNAELLIADDACGDDLICTYSNTNNELGFNSAKFSEGEVDFKLGKLPDDVKLRVNISKEQFKGRNAKEYADVVANSNVFTKKQLLELLGD